MRARPLDPDTVPGLVVERVLELGGGRCRVAVDGAPTTGTEALSAAVAERLRAVGRPAVVVPAGGFLRPASLRYERGRTDPDAYFEDRLDDRGLAREVLDRLEPGGDGRYLPSLWDPVQDRATRAPYEVAPPDLVLLVAGDLLLGRWLPFDLTVHLFLSPPALARRTPPAEHWVLPAFERYTEEVDPVASADLVVRVDDPRHPALVVS